MKKHLTLFVLMLCVVLSCIAFAEGAKDNIAYVFPTIGNGGAMYADENGGYYLLRDGVLFHFNGTLHEEPTLVTEHADGIRSMVAYRGQLYAVAEGHRILRWNETEWEELGRGEWKDISIQLNLIAGDGHLFYYFTDDDDSDQTHLVDFDLSSATFSEITEFPWGVISYDEQDHVLITMSIGDPLPDDTEDDPLPEYIERFNPFTKERLKPILLRGVPSSSGAAYLPSKRCLYFSTDDHHLYRWTWDGGAELMAAAERSSSIEALSNGKVILQHMNDEGYWYIELVEENKKSERLVVQGYETDANTAFTRTTGIDVQCSLSSVEMEDIANLLVTGSKEVDVFAFRMEDGLSLVKNKAFFTDLASNGRLTEAVGQMYPVLTAPLWTENGQLTALPVLAQPYMLAYNREFFEEEDLPIPHTWDELLDSLPAILASDTIQSDYVVFDTIPCTREAVMQRFVRDFILNEQINRRAVDFQQPYFRSVAEKILSRVPAEELFPRDVGGAEEGTEEAVFSLDTVDTTISAAQELPLRVRQDDPPAVFTSVLVLAVNPLSEHQQEAFRYLEFLANLRDPQSYAHIAAMTEPTFYPNQQAVLQKTQARLAAEEQRTVSEADAHQHQDEIERLREEVRELEQSCYMVSPKDIAWYQSVAPNLIATDQPLITADQSFQTLVAQLAEGKMSLDQFVEKANANIRMREME